MRILSNSAKFSVGWPLLPAYNSSATMTWYLSHLSFGGWCGLPKIFGDWKYASNYGTAG